MVRREARRVSTITAETSLRQAQMRNKSGMSEEQAPGQLFITLVPHYSVIEEHAHQLGRRLSRLVQAQQTKQAVTSQPRQHRCPHCGSICDLEISQRKLTSIDGEMTIPDLVGHCRKCRRDFFPSA